MYWFYLRCLTLGACSPWNTACKVRHIDRNEGENNVASYVFFSPPSSPCMSGSFKRRRKDVKWWKCIEAFNRNCLFNTDKVAHKSKICVCPHTKEPWILVWSSATANRIHADVSNSFFLFIFTYWCRTRSPLESASVSAADVLPWHVSSPSVWMSSGHKTTRRG